MHHLRMSPLAVAAPLACADQAYVIDVAGRAGPPAALFAGLGEATPCYLSIPYKSPAVKVGLANLADTRGGVEHSSSMRSEKDHTTLQYRCYQATGRRLHALIWVVGTVTVTAAVGLIITVNRYMDSNFASPTTVPVTLAGTGLSIAAIVASISRMIGVIPRILEARNNSPTMPLAPQDPQPRTTLIRRPGSAKSRCGDLRSSTRQRRRVDASGMVRRRAR
jgi:hypothetical protein